MIPAAYTGSPFPPQYDFELRDHAGQPAWYPGFWNRTAPGPYFVGTPGSPRDVRKQPRIQDWVYR